MFFKYAKYFETTQTSHWANYFIFLLNFIFSFVLCYGVSDAMPRLHDILMVWCIVNCLWLNTLTFKVLLLPMIAWIVFTPIGFQYGYPNAGMIASFFETNVQEVHEFFDIKTILYAVFMIAFSLFIFLITKKVKSTPKQHKFFSYLCIALIILFIVNILPIKKSEFNFSYSKLINLFVHTPQQYNIYIANRDKMRQIQNTPDEWKILDSKQTYQNYVFIMGESASRKYLSAYGYPVQTTPFLDTVHGIKYTNAISPSGYTTLSVPRFLSIPHISEVEYANNIIALANRADIKTYWVSNQDKLGSADNASSYIASKAHHSYFHAEHALNKQRFDHELLPKLQEILNESSSQPKLIIIHLMGSHTQFSHRIDHRLPIFHLKDDYLSNYLSSLYQTDLLLKDIYQALQNNQQPFSMIYTSDHGLSAQTLKHGIGQFNLEVPLFKISSDDRSQITDDRPIAGFGFVWYLSDWLGIKTENHLAHTFIPTPFYNNIGDIKVFDNQTMPYADLPNANEELLLPKSSDVTQPYVK